MSQKYKAPIVGKTFSILRLLSKSERGETLSDLSRQLDISKSTVLGIVSALEEEGAVVRDERTRRYTLGLTLFELGHAVEARIDLNDIARPFMQELMHKTGESVFLGARSGDHITILEIVESTKDLKITAPVGTHIPLLAGATGKVFLACMNETEAADLVASSELRGFTEKSITKPDRLNVGRSRMGE